MGKNVRIAEMGAKLRTRNSVEFMRRYQLGCSDRLAVIRERMKELEQADPNQPDGAGIGEELRSLWAEEAELERVFFILQGRLEGILFLNPGNRIKDFGDSQIAWDAKQFEAKQKEYEQAQAAGRAATDGEGSLPELGSQEGNPADGNGDGQEPDHHSDSESPQAEADTAVNG